jgi:antitoxin MazE
MRVRIHNVITTKSGGTVKTRLVQIGNSKGIRLPKTIIAEAQLGDEVDLLAEPGRIIIRAAKHPREGWAEAAQLMKQRGDDRLLDKPIATRFDREEWKWR